MNVCGYNIKVKSFMDVKCVCLCKKECVRFRYKNKSSCKTESILGQN